MSRSRALLKINDAKCSIAKNKIIYAFFSVSCTSKNLSVISSSLSDLPLEQENRKLMTDS